MRSVSRLGSSLAFGLGMVLCSSCVMTTFEGPGEPPRIPPAPSPIAETPHAHGTANKRAPARAPVADEPHEIAARHLLVSYRGALRAAPGIDRRKDQALQRAQEALRRARAGENFEALVREYSDEPGAAERGGNLGKFERKMMVEDFANAAFALKVGEISEVVETEFGFHVIQRSE